MKPFPKYYTWTKRLLAKSCLNYATPLIKYLATKLMLLAEKTLKLLSSLLDKAVSKLKSH